MPKIKYGTIPAEVRAVVEPLVEKYLVLAPGWLKEVSVYWDEGSSGAAMTTRDEYRDCILYVGPWFLSCDADERDSIIRHEYMHLYTTPIKRIAFDCIQNIVGPDYPTPGSRIAECEIDRLHEAMTEDLSILIGRLLNA